jgi:hypothetical protein
MLKYAYRRSTWVDEYRENTYLAPDNAQWDDIETFLGDLESALMSDCCDAIVTAIEGITSQLVTNGEQLTAITSELDEIELVIGNLEAPLACICAKDPTINVSAIVSPTWPDYPDADKVFQWGTTQPVADIPALVDEDACKLAQCWYSAGFELVTEVFLPIFQAGYGDLLPAAATALAFFTGGTTLPVLIGVYALTDLLQELGEIAWEAAQANLINWMFVHKQDIVCELYTGLKDGGTGTAVWQPVADNVVEPAPDLSAGDKVLINFWYGIVGGYAARIAQTVNSEWYQSVPEAGYCSACPTDDQVFTYTWPPCPNGSWYGTGVCWNTRWCFNHGKYGNAETYLPAPATGTWNKVVWDLEWSSAKAAGWGVGTIRAHYWDGASWQPITPGETFMNQVAAGGTNVLQIESTGLAEPGNRNILFQILAAGGQYETNPYPLMVHSIAATFTQV